MSCTLEPEVWSRDTDQQIPCFDRCQLIITWMFNIKEVHGKPSKAAMLANMLGNSVAVVVVVHTRPQGMPLAMITMRKSTLKMRWNTMFITAVCVIFLINSWGSFSFPYEYGAPLSGPSDRRSSANTQHLFAVVCTLLFAFRILL